MMLPRDLYDTDYCEGLSWADVGTPSAQSLAYQAAWEGMTLLKNDGLLPLSSSYGSVAMIGPWANATGQMQGNYQGELNLTPASTFKHTADTGTCR